MAQYDLNISFGDAEHAGDIANEVSAVLRFLSTVLAWKDDADTELGQQDLLGLLLILESCESSLHRIR